MLEKPRFAANPVPKSLGLHAGPNGTEFWVAWDYFKTEGQKIDPIVELFRALRDNLREKTDLHIVILSCPSYNTMKDGTIVRRYYFTKGTNVRVVVRRDDPRAEEAPTKYVTEDQFLAEYNKHLPALVLELEKLMDRWAEDATGLPAFLESGCNKMSIRDYLVSKHLKKPNREQRLRARREAAHRSNSN